MTDKRLRVGEKRLLDALGQGVRARHPRKRTDVQGGTQQP
jgi:hypothetical protein